MIGQIRGILVAKIPPDIHLEVGGITYEIQVPLFLETGTKVKVDTRSGEYLSRG